jgi:hypothetical protein
MPTRAKSEVQVTDLVASERAISFGPFRLVPTQRLLLEDDNPVRVGSRALDILAALVERPGELVAKHELMARVWRGTAPAPIAPVKRPTRRPAVWQILCRGMCFHERERRPRHARFDHGVARLPGRAAMFDAPHFYLSQN